MLYHRTLHKLTPGKRFWSITRLSFTWLAWISFACISLLALVIQVSK